jgi:sortase A
LFGVLITVLGVAILLYPAFAQAWNKGRQSVATQEYDHRTEQMQKSEIQAELQKADDYNSNLLAIQMPLVNDESKENYDETLDMMGDGVMGYIYIPKIDVKVPIYHYSDNATIAKGVGHMVGSSLPVGGTGTHAILAAHTGMPSSRYFTDLTKMEIGDTFEITVLNRKLEYEIDQIQTVLPNETEQFETIDPNGDYVTLVTCTPYGINTHRLLVRGRRVQGVDSSTVRMNADYTWIRKLFMTGCFALGGVAVVCVGMHIKKKKKKGSR